MEIIGNKYVYCAAYVVDLKQNHHTQAGDIVHSVLELEN